MGLDNRVIMRKMMKNKSHNHVHESKTFSKGQTWSTLTIAPINGMLTKSRNHLFFGHSPQTLTTGVVRLLYPRDMEHLRYNIWCDHYARTSNTSNEERYWRIKSTYVGVKLLDQHGRTGDRDVTQWLPTMTVGRSVSEKSDKMTWRSEWTPCLEKFSEKSFWACSS